MRGAFAAALLLAAGCSAGAGAPAEAWRPGARAMVYDPAESDVAIDSWPRLRDRVPVGAMVVVVDPPDAEGLVRVRAEAGAVRDPLGDPIPPEGVVGLIPAANLRPAD